MLNIEKYGKRFVRDALIESALLDCSILRALAGIGKCPEKDCETCADLVSGWLFSEYTPKFLENGDGLEQGQVIEVSEDGEKWFERKFLTYYKGLFWCYGGIVSCTAQGRDIEREATGWERARFPEEGE